MQRRGILLTFIQFSSLALIQAQNCPSSEDLAPHCMCDTRFSATQVPCRNILSPQDLIAPIRALAKSKTDVDALLISDSSLLYLPDGLFKDTHIKKISFWHTEIMSLSESDVAFRGLEETLTEIRAKDAKFVSQWDFESLRNLHKLDLIDIYDMILNAIDHPFPHLPELRVLGITRAEISYVVDSAFSNLPKLKIFTMTENEITEMKRNMFSDPANNLESIDLSRNQLSSLPEDFFSNMPSLTDVYLDHNKFMTLSEKTFSYALNHINELSMSGNPFRCDCRMRWLVNHKFPLFFKGVCTSPKSLDGKRINELDLKSLVC